MRAQRDMTAREFAKALERNGFRHDFLFWFKDTTGATPNIGYSGIFYRNGKCARRTTIAHLISSRDKELARKAA